MSKEKGENLEGNTNEKKYTEHLCVSKTVKIYVINDCSKKFIKLNPELEGTHITHNQIVTSLIKTYLGIFKLKHGKHNEKISK